MFRIDGKETGKNIEDHHSQKKNNENHLKTAAFLDTQNIHNHKKECTDNSQNFNNQFGIEIDRFGNQQLKENTDTEKSKSAFHCQ